MTPACTGKSWGCGIGSFVVEDDPRVYGEERHDGWVGDTVEG